MGIFDNLFKSKKAATQAVQLVSPVDGTVLSLESVPDAVFSQQMMGPTLAIAPTGDRVQICAPSAGRLATVFPTGHAFGIVTKENMEILVHIGINTVASGGQGFRLLDVKEGDKVEAGTPIVEVDVETLSQSYDLSTMVIVTNPNGQTIDFVGAGPIKKGESLLSAVAE